jgi:hypothetical protein
VAGENWDSDGYGSYAPTWESEGFGSYSGSDTNWWDKAADWGSGFGKGFGSIMSQPQNMLGFAGGLAGLIGQLSGGGVQNTRTPQLDSRGKAQFGAAQNANAGLQPFAQGMTPLQKQQQQLLAAITSGQGLNQNYAKAVEGAFEPQMGSLYEQATQAGRKRGFHDAPATSPAGGNVLGPGLADLQGQIAQAKINMMLGLPALFQNPINSQIGAAQGFANAQNSLFNAYPVGQQQSAPMGPQIGQMLSGFLGGMGAGFGQQQNQQQQLQFQNKFLEALNQRQRPQMQQMPQQTTTPYSFSSYVPNFQLQGGNAFGAPEVPGY